MKNRHATYSETYNAAKRLVSSFLVLMLICTQAAAVNAAELNWLRSAVGISTKRNVVVNTKDGTSLFADVYHPIGTKKTPTQKLRGQSNPLSTFQHQLHAPTSPPSSLTYIRTALPIMYATESFAHIFQTGRWQ